MNVLPSKYLMALFAVSSAPAMATNEYLIDDGVKEAGIGITGTGGKSIAWLNHFTVQPGLQDLSAIRVAFGGGLTSNNIANGTTVTVYLWDDPNQDGDPSDATVLTSATGVVAGTGTNAFSTYAITPTHLPLGRSFFAGAIVNYSGNLLVASIDYDGTDSIPQTPPAMQSWIAGGASGNVVNPGALALAQLPVARVSNALGNDGNWLIRLNAVVATTAAINITPNPLDFGQQIVGSTSGVYTATLESIGSARLDVASIQTPLPPFSVQASGSCPNPPFGLSPGTQCTLDFLFSPMALGPAQQDIAITSNAASSPDKLILQGEGVATDPVLSPPVLAFPETDIDSSSSATLSVLNPGSVPLTVYGSTITGPMPSAFQDMGAPPPCGPYPITLQPGGICDITFEFTPPHHGLFTEQAQLLSNASAGSGTFGLDGTGVIFDDGFEP